MDINALTTAISTVGFPIVTCGVFSWYIYQKDILHKTEMDEMRKTIERNTEIMQKMYDYLSNRGMKDES